MMLKRMIIRIYIFLMNLNKKNYNFFNLNQRENSCFPIYFLFFKLIFLIWSSPGVSAFCTPDEISWSFICRSCLNCPPVSFGSSTLIACDLFSGKGNIVVVGYNYSHLFLSLSFKLILFLDGLIGYLFHISAITFQLIVFWYQYLTAIRTESHFFTPRFLSWYFWIIYHYL